ncbi:MAG TPA: DUF3467 domain-containing protein [Gemmataceae bacterium]|jgi:hypothetical protein
MMSNQLSPIDTRSLPTTYTNYFRASGSAEELILDFGLDPQRHNPNDAPEPTVLLQRLVLTWGNAKQLARMLHDLIQRYEQTHGPIRRANANRPPNPPANASSARPDAPL